MFSFSIVRVRQNKYFIKFFWPSLILILNRKDHSTTRTIIFWPLVKAAKGTEVAVAITQNGVTYYLSPLTSHLETNTRTCVPQFRQVQLEHQEYVRKCGVARQKGSFGYMLHATFAIQICCKGGVQSCTCHIICRSIGLGLGLGLGAYI